jgi:hypothetical protein
MFISVPKSFLDTPDKSWKGLVSGEFNLRHDRDGWCRVSENWGTVTVNAGPPLTYTVVVPSAPSLRFRKSMQLRLKTVRTGSTWQYYYIIAVSAAGPSITLTGGADYALQATDVISNVWISRERAPIGFPGYFTWTPDYGGFTGTPTTTIKLMKIYDDLCFIQHSFEGVSGFDTMYNTLPVTPASLAEGVRALGAVQDNSTWQANPGLVVVRAATPYVDYAKTIASALASWTASNNKGFKGTYSYFI